VSDEVLVWLSVWSWCSSSSNTLTLLFERQKEHLARERSVLLIHLKFSPRRGEGRKLWEQADPDSPEKGPLKYSWWWFSLLPSVL